MRYWDLPSQRTSRTLADSGSGVISQLQSAEAIIADDNQQPGFRSAPLWVVVAILNDWRRGLYVLVAWISSRILSANISRKRPSFSQRCVSHCPLYFFFRANTPQVREISAFHPNPSALVPLFGLLQVFICFHEHFFTHPGMKIYFLYVPLIYVGYALKSPRKICVVFSLFVHSFDCGVGGFAPIDHRATFLITYRGHPRTRTLYRASPITGWCVSTHFRVRQCGSDF